MIRLFFSISSSSYFMMMFVFFFSSEAYAQTPQEAIKAQLGCFEVTFQYKETEAIQEGYELKKPKKSTVIEWVTLEEDKEDYIVLQHVLVSGLAMIKHWRQVWKYEETTHYKYIGHDTWKKTKTNAEEVSGEWSQIVYNVDDGPRYECSALWNNTDEDFWKCTSDAPLPRREKKRSDYTILDRTNVHRITPEGWVHEQYNTKVKLDGNTRIPIAKEKGYNTYIRIPEENCQKAIDWWPKRKATWLVIQKAWEDIRAENTQLKFRKAVGTPLWVRLFLLARDRVDSPKREQKVYTKARKVITKFMVQDTKHE
ncbi:MAG: hypothetical protein CL916_14285 [Deltaproteobacteria bacterium]|nr:hypothetical protein [Deltaproteobacteria bacterium]